MLQKWTWHLNSIKLGLYRTSVKYYIHAEWSILTEINRAGYQDEIFIQSPLSTCGSESTAPVVRRDLFASPGVSLEKQCVAAFGKHRESERWIYVSFGLGFSVAYRLRTPIAGWFCRDESYSCGLAVSGYQCEFLFIQWTFPIWNILICSFLIYCVYSKMSILFH